MAGEDMVVGGAGECCRAAHVLADAISVLCTIDAVRARLSRQSASDPKASRHDQ
ncbi:MAG TPA: hypothetical protein VN213_07990 [Solirubrobacteraceae bacterium]|nr:hypothetical protein [Solirubrobacteraceae bacterium]